MPDDLIDAKEAAKLYRKIMGKSISPERVERAVLDFPHLGTVTRAHAKARPKVEGVKRGRWEYFIKARADNYRASKHSTMLRRDNYDAEGDVFLVDNSEIEGNINSLCRP